VIDVEGDDPVVILGSYNWTGSGAYDNDENTLIVYDRDLARAYYAGRIVLSLVIAFWSTGLASPTKGENNEHSDSSTSGSGDTCYRNSISECAIPASPTK